MNKSIPGSNDPKFDKWHEDTLKAAAKYRTSAKELARILYRGLIEFGEARFWQVAPETDLSEHTISNYLALARAYEPDGWRPKIALGIHEALIPMTPAQRETTFDLIEQFGWNRDEVRNRVAAYRGGELTAFDPRAKVAAPEKKPKKGKAPADNIQEASRMRENEHQGEVSEGAAQAAGSVATYERRAAIDGLQIVGIDHVKPGEKTDFSPQVFLHGGNIAPISANSRLEFMLGLLKMIRTDEGFIDDLVIEGISAPAMQLEAQFLMNLATQIKQRQEIKFNNSGQG